MQDETHNPGADAEHVEVEIGPAAFEPPPQDGDVGVEFGPAEFE
jgi:hypothetical protein